MNVFFLVPATLLILEGHLTGCVVVASFAQDTFSFSQKAFCCSPWDNVGLVWLIMYWFRFSFNMKFVGHHLMQHLGVLYKSY